MFKYIVTIWRPITFATFFSLFLLIFVPKESIGVYIHGAQPFVRVICVVYAVYLLLSVLNLSPLIASFSGFLILFFDYVLVMGIGLLQMGSFSSSNGNDFGTLKVFLGIYLGVSIGFMAIGYVTAYFMKKISQEKLESIDG